MKLVDYIDKKFGGSRAAFARHMGVPPQKITKWLASGAIVHTDECGKSYICTVRREIPVTKSEQV